MKNNLETEEILKKRKELETEMENLLELIQKIESRGEKIFCSSNIILILLIVIIILLFLLYYFSL